MIQNGKLADIPLDIAIDYPIGWSFQVVLRDLVQNFYDAIGAENFDKDFLYTWEKSESGNSYNLNMSTTNHPFSYEWLTYVGGSTKTNSGTANVGQYGEGFKMSVLRIIQMGGMTLTMHSQGWLIIPITYDIEIDDRTVSMLGYEYHEVDDDGITRLTLTGIPLSEKETLQNALLDYFYEDNKLIAEKIGEGDDYSIFHRSDMPIPCKQYDENLKGILFVNHLARGRLDIPLVINIQKEFTCDKRSRPTLTPVKTNELLNGSMVKWGARDSAEVLRILRPYWNDTISNMHDISSKYYFVCQLVRNVSKDKNISETFSKEMEELAYIEKKKSNKSRNRLIDETKRWWMENKSKKLVNPIFRLLGAENLVDTYIHSKNDAYRNPNDKEKRRYDILLKAVIVVVPILKEEDFSGFVISENSNELYDPLQFSERIYGSRKKRLGRKYHITRLVMKEDDFSDDGFLKAFIKVTDAFLHSYGTSRSDKMNALLTYLGVWIFENSEKLSLFESEWLQVKCPSQK